MKYEIITNSKEETINVGYKLGNLLKVKDVVLLTGDLGAGKTTLTKGIGQALDVKRVINSPTFTIEKTYKGKCNLYHLDLYRLNGLNEDFDLEEYFETDGIAVVEWPFQVSELLPSEYLIVKIERLDLDKRRITIENYGDRYLSIVKEMK